MGWLRDFWYLPKKHKEYAVNFWPEKAGREYDKGVALMKQPGTANKLLGALHKVIAGSYYGAGAAADLASESVGGMALDVMAMGKGVRLTKMTLKAANALSRSVKPGGTATKALVNATKLGRQWSDPTSDLFKGRKAFKLASVTCRATGGSGIQTGMSEVVPGRTPPYREPFRQVSLDIHPALTPPRTLQPPKKRQPPPWRASYVDPVKLAAAQIGQNRPEPYRLLGGPSSSSVNMLRNLERRALDQQQRNTWLNNLSRSIRTPTIAEGMSMQQKYGLGKQNTPRWSVLPPKPIGYRPGIPPIGYRPGIPPIGNRLSSYAQGLR